MLKFTEKMVRDTGVFGAMFDSGYRYLEEQQCWIQTEKARADKWFSDMCDQAIEFVKTATDEEFEDALMFSNIPA